MIQLMIEVPETLNQQVQASGVSQQQLGKVMTYFLEMYLKTNQIKEFIQIGPMSGVGKISRKAGSAKHLGITIADDFDDPLEDFSEYIKKTS